MGGGMSTDPFSEKTEGGRDPYSAPSPVERGRGRPSLIYDDDLRSEVLENVRFGATFEVAAAAAGISPRTFYYWKQRGEIEAMRQSQGLEPNPDEVPYLHFLQELVMAEAQAETAMVAEVRLEKGGARYILAARWPERWASASRQTVEVRVQNARAALDSLPPELRSAVEERLLSRVSVPDAENDQVIDG